MENFENIFKLAKKSLNNIRGIFDKENIPIKIKELENISLKKTFGEIKKSEENIKENFFEKIESYKILKK